MIFATHLMTFRDNRIKGHVHYRKVITHVLHHFGELCSQVTHYSIVGIDLSMMTFQGVGVKVKGHGCTTLMKWTNIFKTVNILYTDIP
jgi:hypothetical protein